MDNAKENQSESGQSRGLTRRQFLKTAAVVGAAAMGIDTSQVYAQGGKENPQTPDIPLDEVLTNPIYYINQACKKVIEKVVNENKDLNYYQQEFIDAFSIEHSADRDKAEHNINVLRNGYETLGIGKRVAEIMGRAIAITNNGQVDWNKLFDYGAHQDLFLLNKTYLPFERIAIGGYNYDMGLYELHNDLLLLVDWLEPTMAEDPKSAYRERALEWARSSDVDENVERVTRYLNQARRMGLEDEGVDQATPGAYKDLKLIIQEEKEIFPLANLNTDNIIPNETNTRAYYHPINKDIVLTSILQSLQEQSDEESLSWMLITLIHEQGHGFDPQKDFGAMLYYLEPEALLDYAEGYLEAIEDYYYGVKSLTGAQIEQLMLDPGQVMEIGIDAIDGEEDLEQFRREVGKVKEVAEFAQTEEGQRLVEETNMQWFFGQDGQKIYVAQGIEADIYESLPPLYQSGLPGWGILWTLNTNNVENINHFQNLGKISPEHLDELVKITEQYQAQYAQATGVKQSLIRMKSIYMLASFAYLQHINDIEPIDNTHELYPTYIYLTAWVNDALTHQLTGPVGEYMYRNGMQWDIASDPHDQVERAVELMEQNNRTLAREQAKEQGIHDYYPTQQTGIVETTYRHAAKLQKLRARLWQATDPEGAYADFYHKVAEKVFAN